MNRITGLAGALFGLGVAVVAAPASLWAQSGTDAAVDGDELRFVARKLPLVEIVGQPSLRLRWHGPERTYFGLSDRHLFATDKYLYATITTQESIAPRADGSPQEFNGSVGYGSGRDRFSIPIVQQTYITDAGARRLDAFGVEWRRSFGASQELALSARRGEYSSLDNSVRDGGGNVAQLAWSGEFSGSYRPRLMGSVFVGDEVYKDRSSKWSGRKYYGLSLDGSFTAFDRHVPYASLLLQRSDYTQADISGMLPRRDDYSRLAAGWNWQVRPNWGLRAEANYVLNTPGLPAYDERSQFLFSSSLKFK